MILKTKSGLVQVDKCPICGFYVKQNDMVYISGEAELCKWCGCVYPDDVEHYTLEVEFKWSAAFREYPCRATVEVVSSLGGMGQCILGDGYSGCSMSWGSWEEAQEWVDKILRGAEKAVSNLHKVGNKPNGYRVLV